MVILCSQSLSVYFHFTGILVYLYVLNFFFFSEYLLHRTEPVLGSMDKLQAAHTQYSTDQNGKLLLDFFNALAPGRCRNNFKYVICEHFAVSVKLHPSYWFM